MKHRISVGSLITIGALACNKAEGEYEPAAPSGSGTASHEDAVRRIVSSRCQGEEACNNIGNGKRYDDSESCEREVRQNTRSSLRPAECPAIGERQLDDCIDEVRNQACNSPIDEVARLTACRQTELCLSSR